MEQFGKTETFPQKHRRDGRTDLVSWKFGSMVVLVADTGQESAGCDDCSSCPGKRGNIAIIFQIDIGLQEYQSVEARRVFHRLMMIWVKSISVRKQPIARMCGGNLHCIDHQIRYNLFFEDLIDCIGAFRKGIFQPLRQFFNDIDEVQRVMLRNIHGTQLLKDFAFDEETHVVTGPLGLADSVGERCFHHIYDGRLSETKGLCSVRKNIDNPFLGSVKRKKTFYCYAERLQILGYSASFSLYSHAKRGRRTSAWGRREIFPLC